MRVGRRPVTGAVPSLAGPRVERRCGRARQMGSSFGRVGGRQQRQQQHHHRRHHHTVVVLLLPTADAAELRSHLSGLDRTISRVVATAAVFVADAAANAAVACVASVT